MRFLLCLVLALAACGDDAPPPDDTTPRDAGELDLGGPPRVEIGTGVTEFVEVADGADVELVNGPQGGWHVDVAMRLYSVDPQELTMRIEGYDAATDMAIGVPIERTLTERRVQREGDHWLRVGDQLIFAIEAPEEVVGSDVRIEARIVTPEGVSAEAQKVVHVVDEAP